MIAHFQSPPPTMMRSRKQHSKASEYESQEIDNSNSKLGKPLQDNQKLIIALVVFFVLAVFGFYSYESKHASPTVVNFEVDAADVSHGISLIPPDLDADLVRDKDGQIYHVIFSTDCGTYQHWQSYMTFYRAMKVRQPGHVTRIASGCTPEEKVVIENWFDNHIRHMSDRFHLMLTPHFSQVKDEEGNVIGDYKVREDCSKHCCCFVSLYISLQYFVSFSTNHMD